VAQSTAVSTVNDALEAAERIGYPLIVRAAYTLGGLGSGFANNPDELRDLAAKGLSLSPQILVERSMKGWKELEYEVVRDGADVSSEIKLTFPSINIAPRRIRLSVAIWKTLTPSARIQVTLSSWLLLKPFRMMNTTCYGVLLSKSSVIWASSANVTFSMHSTLFLGNIALLRSMLGKHRISAPYFQVLISIFF
jgi:hypothetical protein